MFSLLLMGAQAAGSITSAWGAKNEYKQYKRATELENSQLDLRIQQERISSNEMSIDNLEQLKETLATQRAFMAVRGITPGVGTGLAMANKSIRNFNRDEQARELSLNIGVQQIKAQKSVNKLSLLGKRQQLGTNLAIGAFNNMNFSSMIGDVSRKGAFTGSEGAPVTRLGANYKVFADIPQEPSLN